MNIQLTKNYISLVFALSLWLLISGCNPAQLEAIMNSVGPQPTIVEETPMYGVKEEAKKFLAISALGKSITTNQQFTEFINLIPSEKKGDRIFVVRVDELSIGSPYSAMDKWDLALENGLIDGVLNHGFKVAEKLDYVSPRKASEFMNTTPMDGFYMHGLNLADLGTIQNVFKSNLLLEYQVLEFSDQSMSAIVYLRIVDLNSMKVVSSKLIKEGAGVESLPQNDSEKFKDIYNVVANIDDFPSEIFSSNAKLGLLDLDILNTKGSYRNVPSKELMAVENGLITGLLYNDGYSKESPVVIEKTDGFKLKFPQVYKNLVFNTNPILYEEWDEFNRATNCNYLFMYRYLKDDGIYIRIINTASNGRIVYSKAVSFLDKDGTGLIANHDAVVRGLTIENSIDLSNLSGRKVLILDGDKHSIEAGKYFSNLTRFDEMHLSVEEGIISAFTQNDILVYEKLKTLYLKRPWMYSNKVFNLNPLYLEAWSQMEDFGVDMLVIFNSLLPYEDLTKTQIEYKNVVMGLRVVDLKTGEVIDIGEISTIN